MRTIAGYYISEGGSVNIPAIVASLAGLATFFTFLAKSIHRVKPGEQAIRLRGGRIVRYRHTRPEATTYLRMFLWFGPTIVDQYGNARLARQALPVVEEADQSTKKRRS